MSAVPGNATIPLFSSSREFISMQILVAVLAVVLVFLQYMLWIDAEGVRQTHTLRITVQAQTEENAALAERNKALEAEVKDLKNGLMAIEERARAEMGMIRRDETFYRILEQPPSKAVGTLTKPTAANPTTTAHKPAVISKPSVAPTKPEGQPAKPVSPPHTAKSAPSAPDAHSASPPKPSR